MTHRTDAFGVPTNHDVRDVSGAELLSEGSESRHARQDFTGDGRRVIQTFDLSEARIAGATASFTFIGAVPFVPEVLDHCAMATTQAAAPRRGLGEQVELGSGVPGDRLAVTTVGDGFFSRSLDQSLPSCRVGGRVEQYALRGKSVPSRPSSLLLVVLQRFRHIRVNHAPDVAAIDAHAEGDRRDDHRKSVSLKGLMDLVALRCGEPGVIARRLDSSVE